MENGGGHSPCHSSRSSSKKCRPRLFIKEMIMRNFKSYAGEQRVGPFHKSFSAVVGPNGSGKSNVIDAMLFVFGKRAKQMRLNKVSELIHNSTNYQNLDSAGVSVQFQEIVDLDDGDFEVVPGSDFTITRVAFRDNSSKYFIDNRSSNFTEVTKLLKGKGVDLDNNRFLILQGEVEQISLMKPKGQGPHDEGFLEYLEDIIGTTKYLEKIEETSKDLESLNDKRSGVVQMVKLAEKERDSLEDVKNEAEAYMLKELLSLKWQEKASRLAYDETSGNIDELKENLVKLEDQVTVERSKIQKKTKELKELETVHKKYMKRQEELDKELRNCKDEFKEFERQDVKFREDMKHMKQKIKKIEDKVTKDSTKIIDLTKECEESQSLIPKLENAVPVLQNQLQDEERELEIIVENSKVESEKYRSELIMIRAELEPWEKKLIDHRGKLDLASTEAKLLTDKHEDARAAFEDAKKKIVTISERVGTQSVCVERLKHEIEKQRVESADARKVEQKCIKEQEILIPLEQAARQKVAELNAIVESEKSHGSVMKAIYQARDSRKIDGIYGRLGDLGAIDAKYDVAISTACPGLDYVVVETTAAAEACVQLLRQNNLGVATFLIMEKQVDHVSKMKESTRTPEGIPRLFDLVAVQDERMRLAFYAMLGNTVVAKDLDQATRVAYGGNPEFRRVVTIDGALFEKSGTMSGGGTKPRGGKMGSSIRATSVSAESVVDAQTELSELVHKLSSLRDQISNAVRSYESAENEISKMEMDLAKAIKEIESLLTEKEDILKQLSSLEVASKPKENEIERSKELQKIKLSEEKEIDALVKGSKLLKDKASELQNKIENAGGEKLKLQKLKVNKIQSDIDNKSTEINRRKVQLETSQKMIKKLTKSVDEGTLEKERLVEEKDKLKNIFKEIEVKAFAVQENYKKTEMLIDQHREVLEKAKVDYENVKKIVDLSRAAEVDAEFKLQDIKKCHKEMESKGNAYKKKVDNLKNAVICHIEQIQKDLVDPDKLKTTLEDVSNGGDSCDLKRALEMVALLEAQLKEMNPNLDSISEYRRKVSLYNDRVEELNTVTQQRDDIKRQYDEFRKRRLDEFMEGFNVISLKLKEMYQMITLGGDAELELVDSLDPFSEGVVFSVRPPKKSWKNIANLSGGEKTLSSLAFVFALHHYKPTPLYVMDEIDAALDFKNVSIVGHYVKDRTKDAQFIIISLRNNMFELADRLVGIYKTDNCTKSITINPGSFVVCQNAS